MIKGTILLLDDDQEELNDLTSLLTEQGHQVLVAKNGVEAMTHLNSLGFHLVLAKIPMPQVNAIELLRIVTERWRKKLPVVFLTDQVNVEMTFTAIKEGARDLLLKPFDKKTLLECVQYNLETKSVPVREELEQRYKEKLRQHQAASALKKNVADLLSLDEITKALGDAQEPKEVGWVIMNMVQQLIEANRIALVVYGHSREEVHFNCTYSDSLGILDELVPLDQEVAEWLFEHRRELMMTNLEKEAKYLGFTEEHIQAGSLLALPFIGTREILGLIVLHQEDKAAFNTALVRFLSVLARVAAMALEKIQSNQALKQQSVGTIRALISAVEAKDSFTMGHAARVGRYALMLAKQLGMDADEIRRLEYMAILHDIGKIGIPEHILRKNTELTEADWIIIKSHPELGASIVQYLDFLPGGQQVILHHHEWYNGKGYPEGLAGEDIPLFSRIISIADAFDSMTSETHYKPVMTTLAALAELEAKASQQFDPALVQVFLRAYHAQNDKKTPPKP